MPQLENSQESGIIVRMNLKESDEACARRREKAGVCEVQESFRKPDQETGERRRQWDQREETVRMYIMTGMGSCITDAASGRSTGITIIITITGRRGSGCF